MRAEPEFEPPEVWEPDLWAPEPPCCALLPEEPEVSEEEPDVPDDVPEVPARPELGYADASPEDEPPLVAPLEVVCANAGEAARPAARIAAGSMRSRLRFPCMVFSR